jgi:YVTN family beta-propeller protein
MVRVGGFIPVPGPRPTSFDHGAWDAGTGRVFIAHTAANAVDVLDGRGQRHERTLVGHTEAAGVVAGGGMIAVTNRGADSLSLLDAATLAPIATHATGARPNGVALAPRSGLAVVACVGTDDRPPSLDCIDIRGDARRTLALPGRPRWCVLDAAEERLYCAIREPSAVLVVELRGFSTRACWPLPSGGAHGIDLDPAGRLFVACDGGSLIALAAGSGAVIGQWSLPGVPDATFFNPATGRVHVAIGDPGVVVSVDPDSGRQAATPTEPGAKTTALAPPDALYVFLPQRGGALVLFDEPNQP